MRFNHRIDSSVAQPISRTGLRGLPVDANGNAVCTYLEGNTIVHYVPAADVELAFNVGRDASKHHETLRHARSYLWAILRRPPHRIELEALSRGFNQ